jgi:glycerol-3-phosphate acyltransferase PlsY
MVLPYCIGAIPTGYLFAKYFFGVDITTQGSGNIGATNVARVFGNIRYFFLIFLIDATKAGLYLFLMQSFLRIRGLSTSWLLVMAVMLLLGNSYSCFLKGRGGKGVATLIGILLAIAPIIFIISIIITWLLLFVCFRRIDFPVLISLLFGCVLYRVFWYQQSPEFMYFLVFVLFFICFRHYKNIASFFQASSHILKRK